jgi:hypothetical protein
MELPFPFIDGAGNSFFFAPLSTNPVIQKEKKKS